MALGVTGPLCVAFGCGKSFACGGSLGQLLLFSGLETENGQSADAVAHYGDLKQRIQKQSDASSIPIYTHSFCRTQQAKTLQGTCG